MIDEKTIDDGSNQKKHVLGEEGLDKANQNHYFSSSIYLHESMKNTNKICTSYLKCF